MCSHACVKIRFKKKHRVVTFSFYQNIRKNIAIDAEGQYLFCMVDNVIVWFLFYLFIYFFLLERPL